MAGSIGRAEAGNHQVLPRQGPSHCTRRELGRPGTMTRPSGKSVVTAGPRSSWDTGRQQGPVGLRDPARQGCGELEAGPAAASLRQGLTAQKGLK